MPASPPNLIDTLKSRTLVHQITDEPALRQHLSNPQSNPRRAYVGYDPTADSLTIGNLVTIMMLVHAQRAGHQPVVLMGGGTGLIGDPSGKSAERELQTEDRVRANVESIQTLFAGLLEFDPAGARAKGWQPALMVNNLDWLGKLGYIEVLRDVGKFFSVNQMIQRDSVKNRLENREQGISYTEFSYMLLQAYDYLHLYRDQRVTLQMGGSDQFGNIVSGADLIRRHEHVSPPSPAAGGGGGRVREAGGGEGAPHAQAFGLVCPLVTKADGGKFGKTESGAIWLTAPRSESDTSKARTSVYAYYQFWLNAADADVPRFLRVFTLLPIEQIEALESSMKSNPGAREAQRALAREATALLHGATARDQAEAAAAALFSGDIASLPLATLNEVLASAPASTHPRAQLEGDGTPLIDILAVTLCKSKSEARQALQDNSISVNGRKVGPAERLCTKDLLHNTLIALRRGKKSWHVTRWS